MFLAWSFVPPINQYKIYIMVQLIPFFLNKITFTFAILSIAVYMLSKYILPRFVPLFLPRTFTSLRRASAAVKNFLLIQTKSCNNNAYHYPYYIDMLVILLLVLLVSFLD